MSAEALLKAIETHDTDAVAHLVAADPGLRLARDDHGVSLLLHAIYRCQSQMVELLRHDQLDGFEAAALGDVEALVRRLYRDDMLPLHVNGDGYTALHLAAWFCRPNVARILIATGADVDARAENEFGARPLHAAVAGGSESVLQQLLLMGADPDLPRSGGLTPLHAAAAMGKEQMVRLLLEAGANRLAVAEDGTTPCDLAIAAGHPELCDLLR